MDQSVLQESSNPDARHYSAENNVLSNLGTCRNSMHRRRLSSRSNALSVFSDVFQDASQDQPRKKHHRKPTLEDVALRVRTLTALTRERSSGRNLIISSMKVSPTSAQGLLLPPTTRASSEPKDVESQPLISPPANRDASEQLTPVVAGEPMLNYEAESPFDTIFAAPLPQKHHRSTSSNTEHLFRNVETLDMLFQQSQVNDSVNASDMQPTSDTSENNTIIDQKSSEIGNQKIATENIHTDLEARNSSLKVSVEETTPLIETEGREPLSSTCRTLVQCIKSIINRFVSPCVSKSGKSVSGSRSKKPLWKFHKGSQTNKRSSAHTALKDIVDPRVMIASLGVNFFRSTMLLIVLPGLSVAMVLFYGLNNPRIECLPGNASFSWWLLFAVRQCVTFHLARITEYILVEALALRSAMCLQLCGPLLTLFLIQSQGWPFVVASWGCWDLVLIHDSNPFSKNWLFFLKISMLSEENPSGNVLNSGMYLRFLLAFIIAGATTSIKRTYLALYLGKRSFVHYKPQLNRIIADIKLLADVAELAAEVDSPEFEQAMFMAEKAISPTNHANKTVVPWDIQFQADGKKKTACGKNEDPRKHSPSGKDDESCSLASSWDGSSRFDEGSPFVEDEASTSSGSEEAAFCPWGTQDSFGTLEIRASTRSKAKKHEHHERNNDEKNENLQGMDSSVDHLNMKRQLERWEDPIGSSNKLSDPSMHDILQFRKALSYMEDTCPFSLSFGPADTRDRCIRSSQRLYKKLLKYTPELDTLQFSVISVLAYDENGKLNEIKNKALTRLFRPDMNKEISCLAFVQSCDNVYKRLRFFLAAVRNSVIIDGVLEKVVNSLFYLVLTLVLLALLNVDAWRLLVSLSTLMVSFAFAFGPSTAAYIDGILLIAVRRPYDLGDRISFSEPNGAFTSGQSWIVEDITLTTTVLRFAATNEVATISNSSVAKSRILNGSKSHRAVVTLNLIFRLDTTHEQLQKFLSRVEKYVKNRPRTWTAVTHFRNERLVPGENLVEYSLRMQHQKPWQDEAAILRSKADLNAYCNELSKRMGIRFQCVPKSLDVSILNSNQILSSMEDAENPPRQKSHNSAKLDETQHLSKNLRRHPRRASHRET